MKEINWNFPHNDSGRISGLAEAGIEFFKDRPLASLAREICQNSLDAQLNKDQPVKIEFSLEEIATTKFPGYMKFKDSLESCLAFGKKSNHEETISFFSNALHVLNKPRLPVLRISDFNTTGLTGSDKFYGTPWADLVKSSGVSNKSGESGGSFGIGKSAPFASSDLRTVFYNTYDQEGVTASQGVSRLISFPIDDQGRFTDGTGYFGITKGNLPLKESPILFPKFSRGNSSGTDIFIMGFENSPDWKDEIVSSILDNFLISIYRGLLDIKVDDIHINKDTLSEIIQKYPDTPEKAYNYYKVLTSPETKHERIPFEDLGELELYLLINNDLHRRVLMSRSNGMKIFDDKGYKSGILFAGICILSGKDLNAYFRKMENPEHTKWVEDRYGKRKGEARKKRLSLSRTIKERLIELGKNLIADELDAEGIGDFLPDNAFDLDNGNQNKETLSNETLKDSVDLKTAKLKRIGSNYFENTKSKTEVVDQDGILVLNPYGESGSKDYGDEDPNISHNGNNFGTNEGEGSGILNDGSNSQTDQSTKMSEDSFIKDQKQIKGIQTRLIQVQNSNSTYRLILIPNINLNNSYIEIELSGEQKNQEIIIEEAKDPKSNLLLPVEKNKILLGKLEKNHKYLLDFQIKYNELSSMEAKIYGNKT